VALRCTLSNLARLSLVMIQYTELYSRFDLTMDIDGRISFGKHTLYHCPCLVRPFNNLIDVGSEGQIISHYDT
jgi:hypothetical protein